MSTRAHALVVHSGGPTAVINASLAGIVEEARKHAGIGTVFGARWGIDGVIANELIDLSALDARTLAAVAEAPASAIGSSRRRMTGDDFDRALATCRARGIRWLFYTGGNGSMETAADLGKRARAAGQDLAVIGVPKTIDNDLTGTDHTPGYASAARFFACAVRDIGADNRALPGQVQVLEVLGRHTGWIAAATTLVRRDEDQAPHLVYLPERPLPLSRLLDDVQRVFDRLGRCVVVVCEGQLDERGEPFGADTRVNSRGTLAMNLAHHLASIITRQLSLKARSEKPGIVGRVSAALRSDVDWREARMCGETAVRAAIGGASDVMVTITREPGPEYRASTGSVPLEQVAGIERRLPDEWIGADGHLVRSIFEEYVRPLVGPVDDAVWLS